MPDSIAPSAGAVTVSIVSHGHGAMVWALIDQLRALPEPPRIILTLNMPEAVPESIDPGVTLIRNAQPKGFGANHNAAFACCDTEFFCVLNPDIELIGDPFPKLCTQVAMSHTGVCAPLILGSNGAVEDSVRQFMTPWRMLLRKLGLQHGNQVLEADALPAYPDWVAGMFMLFKAASYRRVNGFDESYFMYCEDADICTRLWQAGERVVVCPDMQAIHHAQRASRRDLRHLRWHLASMFRYFARYWGRLPHKPRQL